MGYHRRADILNKRNKRVKYSNLNSFFQEKRIQELSGGLAHLYLESIEEACARQDIEFETSIARDERKEETITRLHISL